MAPEHPSPHDGSWPEPALLQRAKETVKEMIGLATDSVHTAVVPYRICPIGAHVDHQGGTVTAMAIDRGVILAFAPSHDQTMRLCSGQFGGTVKFSLNKIPPGRLAKSVPSSMEEDGDSFGSEECRWGDYARGAAMALRKRGHHISKGMVGYLEGSPGFDGGGLSSSAAVGVAFLLALEHVNNLHVSDEENIELDRLIENEYLGLRIGILDQSAILLSRRHCLTRICCKDRTFHVVPPPGSDCVTCRDETKKYKILIAFSGLRHALAGKPGYNMRVDECQTAAKTLLRAVGRPTAEALLCNVTPTEYSQHKDVLHGTFARRAEHFFTEIARVHSGVEAWSSGDLTKFGRLMSESGQSSIGNYECGCDPLVQMRQILLDAPGVYGARFSGAGFRGCCVAFVAAHLADSASEYVQTRYKQAQPHLAKNIVETPVVVVCESADRAHILEG